MFQIYTIGTYIYLPLVMIGFKTLPIEAPYFEGRAYLKGRTQEYNEKRASEP
jgi:hypothetical protein